MFIPFVVTADFLVNMSTYSALTSILFVIVDVIECAIIYALIRRFAPNFKDIGNRRTAIVIPLAAIIGSVIGGVVGGVFVVIQYGRSDFSQYDSEFVKWFISDCLGHVTVIPFMMSLTEFRPMLKSVRKYPMKGLTAVGCFVMIMFLELAVPAFPTSRFIFVSIPNTVPYLSHVFAVPFVLFSGFYIGAIGYTASALLLTVSGVIGIIFIVGEDNFATGVLLFRLQLHVLAVMISTFSLIVIEKGRQDALLNAMQANNQKSAFIAFLCHELRNPIHAILNINTFLKEMALTPEQHQLCEAASIASTYMSHIINDVLDTSKFEAGNIHLSQKPVDLEEVFKRIALQSRVDLRIRGIELDVNIGWLPTCTFWADEMRFQQLLNNLFAHAIKVTTPGSRMECGMWCQDVKTLSRPSMLRYPASTHFGYQRHLKKKCTLCIEVSNSGSGVSAVDLGRITFKPFDMDRLETSQEYTGTGLGLAICKQIVDLMKGTIEVKPKFGNGNKSTFLVKIPVALCEPGATLDECTEIREAPSSFSPKLSFTPEDLKMDSVPVTLSLPTPNVKISPQKNSDGIFRTSADFVPDTPWLLLSVNREPVLNFSNNDNDVAIKSDLETGAIPPLTNDLLGFHAPMHPPASLVRPLPTASQKERNPLPLSNNRKGAIKTGNISDRAILVVDDSSINRKILVRLLRLSGVISRIEECTNGQEAVDCFRARPFGYTGIFMDLQMPVMDGTEATKKIREIEDELYRRGDGVENNGRKSLIPIVAATASFVDEESLKKDFGFTSVAPKPFLKTDAERLIKTHEMA